MGSLEKLEQIKKIYSEQKKKVSFLIAGDMGSGKTTLIGTARKPVLLHSFDPGGPKVLRPLIEKGEVIVDDRWEKDSPDNPIFAEWDKEFDDLKRSGVFNDIGTFALDSATNFGEAVMRYILKKANRAESVPFQKDYLTQMLIIQNFITELMNLPCDVILTAHLDPLKDELTGKVKMQIMITGKLRTKIPLMFDEIYVAMTKKTREGIQYVLLTKNDGFYEARTRIGKDVFDTYEKPDIQYLLRKANYLKS